MQLGDWQLDTVNGGRFRLDGGVMFGVVPKTLWERVAPPDAQNRIPVANHCVLARDGKRTVLIDTGYGDKFGRLDRRFYDMQAGAPLLESLEELGVAPDDVDAVVFSHLHFDHLCGAVRRDPHRGLVATFPTARHFIGRCEWEEATGAGPELESAYRREDLQAIADTDRISLLDDGDEIVPGVSVRLTGGHTRGHLSIVIRSRGETALYPGDICPSTYHLRRMWHLAYDVFPLDTRRRKPQLLGEAADKGWWLLWNHDPLAAVSRLARDPKREFAVVDARSRL